MVYSILDNRNPWNISGLRIRVLETMPGIGRSDLVRDQRRRLISKAAPPNILLTTSLSTSGSEERPVMVVVESCGQRLRWNLSRCAAKTKREIALHDKPS